MHQQEQEQETSYGLSQIAVTEVRRTFLESVRSAFKHHALCRCVMSALLFSRRRWEPRAVEDRS
jgi:hypothetical protein